MKERKRLVIDLSRFDSTQRVDGYPPGRINTPARE